MSILGKKWLEPRERGADESLWSALLASRAVQDPGQFFGAAQIEDLHDPFLLPDMEKSVARIQTAIKNRERIVIYGDYDVDGISGSALLIHTLRFLGGEVSYRIPHRMNDGYGLHASHVQELATQDVKILVTVDLGISCAAEVKLAQDSGIDVILTDHHAIPDTLPKPFAVLHPKLAPDYPFKELSGSGVAFKLASALMHASGNPDLIITLTDLASLGTVADCVPLVGENRMIVKLGLKQMRNTKWEGLRALLRTAGVWGEQNFSEFTIGFQLGPRINASGRMDNPYWALQALISKGKEAEEKSQKLEMLNLQRQELTRTIQEEAEASLDHSMPILLASGRGWSSGIVGLIAGRLQEKYGKPTFILEERDDIFVGSARSLPGFHAVEAIKQAADLLESFGGHAQAAGFHLKKENYPAFAKTLLAYAQDFFADTPVLPQLQVDAQLRAGEISLENCEKIASFAPFGIGNATPHFLLKNVKILDSKPVGRTAAHLKFRTDFAGDPIDGIAFNFAEHEDALRSARDLIVTLEANTWNNISKPQIKLVDFA